MGGYVAINDYESVIVGVVKCEVTGSVKSYTRRDVPTGRSPIFRLNGCLNRNDLSLK